MSATEVERITAWHEAAYRRISELGGQDIEYLGLRLVVPPKVQPVAPVAHPLGEAVLAEVRPDDRVLDMGTGSGVNAILAARVAREVVAVDLNPFAVAAARANAERNGVADRVEVRHGDIFDTVAGDFDLIVFDPPFRWFTPRDELEMATTDPGYRGMRRFFDAAASRLRPGGRMLIFFGTSGDLAFLRELMARNGFAVEEISRLDGETDGTPVSYFTFRLTVG